jgi:hypothetical protein
MDSMKLWTAGPRDSAALFDELFLTTPAAEAWQSRTTQPLSALERPAEPADVHVPVIQLGALDDLDDLDALARGLAADVEPEPRNRR